MLAAGSRGTMDDVTTPAQPQPTEGIPARLVAEADQLTALGADLGASTDALVITALAEAVLEGDDGSEGIGGPS